LALSESFVIRLLSTVLSERSFPVEGVTFTPDGISTVYLNFTGKVDRVGLDNVIFNVSPLQIVSDKGVAITLALGSTHTNTVSFMPMHFSPSSSKFLI